MTSIVLGSPIMRRVPLHKGHITPGWEIQFVVRVKITEPMHLRRRHMLAKEFGFEVLLPERPVRTQGARNMGGMKPAIVQI